MAMCLLMRMPPFALSTAGGREAPNPMPLQLLGRRSVVIRGKAFSTPAYFFENPFKLLQFFGGSALEGAFDERRMPAKQRDKHLASFFRQRYRSDPPIRTTLDTANEPLSVQAIHRHADRARIQVHLRSNVIYRHRSLMKQHFENPKVRLAQPLLQQRRRSIARHRLPGFQHDEPGMEGLRSCFALFH